MERQEHLTEVRCLGAVEVNTRLLPLPGGSEDEPRGNQGLQPPALRLLCHQCCGGGVTILQPGGSREMQVADLDGSSVCLCRLQEAAKDARWPPWHQGA